ncbi:MAG: hypothetical protein AABO41_10105 [Acidobacteriota bacterium]
MDRIPFVSYDFFGYLSSGLVLVAGMQRVVGFPQVTGRELTVAEGALLILAIYVGGQVIASPSRAFLEDLVVSKVLQRPHTVLLRERQPWRRLLFPGYYTALPQTIRQRVIERAKGEGTTETGEALFLHIRFHEVTRQDEKLMARLEAFLNQYGFARNLAFTCLFVGVALVIKGRLSNDVANLEYGVTAIVAALLLFYRYLKFFRQYTYELFNSYAGGKR